MWPLKETSHLVNEATAVKAKDRHGRKKRGPVMGPRGGTLELGGGELLQATGVKPLWTGIKSVNILLYCANNTFHPPSRERVKHAMTETDT